ncbi:MAG: leucine--tRNA ligase [Candidatus Berkelbacteria bacterium]
MKEYNFSEIEVKWQKHWADTNYGIATDNSDKPKFYSLVEFPYPSGSGLHVGHCMGYGASDAYCRMKRMQGFNVMFPIGWDAFGLPTENYAIKNKIKPQIITTQAIDTFRTQMKALGYSFDWSREVNTTDPDYYKWTQWIFSQFYKHSYQDGKLIEVADNDTTTPRMAYQAEMTVNWCPSCKIVLANEEVVNGACERCGTSAEKRNQKQWMLRITAYAERLIDDLANIDYLDTIKTQQTNWIGKSVGANIKFKIKDNSSIINVFTTRADTLFGCTYVVLAPENPLINELKSQIKNISELEDYVLATKNKSDLERAETVKEKTGVKLEGVKAINPINNQEVEVYVADYVLASYGTGAVMAVPAHDDRDFAFAKKYNIEIRQVITNSNKNINVNDNAYTDYGILINSGEFDGLTSEDAKTKITEKLKSINAGELTKNFKMRDWIFSRQHYWGEPIPIIHCDKCGGVPVPEDQLPVTLPDIENYEPTTTGESPLAKIDSWVNVECPICGGKAKRETDTMPNWAGSSWYFLRYTDPKNPSIIANMENLKYWTPIDLYNGGPEHITLHLLYSRFWHKFLFDLNAVPTTEPYQKRILHGIILGPDGQKMSKSKGNVINPDEMVKKFGADTLRAYIMFIGPYDQESAWNMAGIQGVFRFLNRVWNNAQKVSSTKDTNDVLVKLNQTIKAVTEDLENYHMNTVISKLMELNNLLEKQENISENTFKLFLQILYPACPHLSSELWESFDSKKSIENTTWPKADENFLMNDEIEIAIQINGKTRQIVKVNPQSSQEEVETMVKNDPKIQELIKNAQIRKTIYVSGRILNFVI